MAPEQSGEWKVRLASSLAVKSDSCPFFYGCEKTADGGKPGKSPI